MRVRLCGGNAQLLAFLMDPLQFVQNLTGETRNEKPLRYGNGPDLQKHKLRTDTFLIAKLRGKRPEGHPHSNEEISFGGVETWQVMVCSSRAGKAGQAGKGRGVEGLLDQTGVHYCPKGGQRLRSGPRCMEAICLRHIGHFIPVIVVG